MREGVGRDAIRVPRSAAYGGIVGATMRLCAVSVSYGYDAEGPRDTRVIECASETGESRRESGLPGSVFFEWHAKHLQLRDCHCWGFPNIVAPELHDQLARSSVRYRTSIR